MLTHLYQTLMILLVVTGKVIVLEDAALETFHAEMAKPMATDQEDPKLSLKAGDIYKELRLRGYDYGKTFQGILESNNAGNASQTNLQNISSFCSAELFYVTFIFSQVTVESFIGRVTG